MVQKLFLLVIVGLFSIFSVDGATDPYYLPPLPSAPWATTVGWGGVAPLNFNYTWPWGTNWTHRANSTNTLSSASFYITHSNDAHKTKSISWTLTSNFNYLKAHYTQCPTKTTANSVTQYQRLWKVKVQDWSERDVYILFCYWGYNTIRVYHRVQNNWVWTKDQAIYHWSIRVNLQLASQKSTWGGLVVWNTGTSTWWWQLWTAVQNPSTNSDSWSAELSLPFASMSTCGAAKDSNNIKYPKFVRSDCFLKNEKYYYYICEKWDNFCNSSWSSSTHIKPGPIDNTNNVTTWVYNWNPFKWNIDSSLLSKLSVVVKRIEKLDVAWLKQMKNKLSTLKVKFSAKPVIINLINYLTFEVDRIIKEKTKDSDIDDFFCALSGDCGDDVVTGDPRICTQETKTCPDGKTLVSRTWPNCEFKACPVVTINPAANDTCTIKDKSVDLKMYGCKKGDYNTVFKRSDMSCFVWPVKAPLTGKWIKDGTTYSFGGNNLVEAQRLECKWWTFYKSTEVTNPPASTWSVLPVTPVQKIDRNNKKWWYTTDLYTNRCTIKNIHTKKCSCPSWYQATQTVSFGWSLDSNFNCYKIILSAQPAVQPVNNWNTWWTIVDGWYTKDYSWNCTKPNPQTWKCTCQSWYTAEWATGLIWEVNSKCTKKVAQITKWVCGPLNGSTVSTMPTSSTSWLCKVGKLDGSAATGNPWQYNKMIHWRCQNIGNYDYASCSARPNEIINWKCGDVNWKTIENKPTYDLCKSGTLAKYQFVRYNTYKKADEYAWKCMWNAFWQQSHFCRAYVTK